VGDEMSERLDADVDLTTARLRFDWIVLNEILRSRSGRSRGTTM